MSIKTDILQGGSNNHGVTVDDLNAFATDFLVDGIVGTISSTAGVAPTTGGFAINQNGTPGKNVVVSAGTAYITGTPTDGVSQRMRVVNDTAPVVTIADNATGATKYDWIYLKLDADKMKNPGVNSDDVCTLVVSRSSLSTSDNGTPPTYGYCIAVVTVANNFTSITNASIADKRARTYPFNPYVATPDSAWHNVGGAGEPAFQNSWVNYDNAWQVIRFYKDAMGWVTIEGLCKSGSNGTIFILPVGYRPTTSTNGLIFITMCTDASGRIDISPSGSVIKGAVGTNSYVSLSGIRFKAE